MYVEEFRKMFQMTIFDFLQDRDITERQNFVDQKWPEGFLFKFLILR